MVARIFSIWTVKNKTIVCQMTNESNLSLKMAQIYMLWAHLCTQGNLVFMYIQSVEQEKRPWVQGWLWAQYQWCIALTTRLSLFFEPNTGDYCLLWTPPPPPLPSYTNFVDQKFHRSLKFKAKVQSQRALFGNTTRFFSFWKCPPLALGVHYRHYRQHTCRQNLHFLSFP